MFKNVDGRTDGRRSHWYTYSSPGSLRLRSANNKKYCPNYFSEETKLTNECEVYKQPNFAVTVPRRCIKEVCTIH